MGKRPTEHAENATLTKGPNDKDKKEKQDASRETNIKETTPIVNRRRETGKHLSHPCATVKGTGNKRQQKHLEYPTERKTLISMEKGLRTLNIAILNPDSMRGKEMQQEILKDLTKNKIHPAAIQETHITRDCNYMMGNYRVITSAADKSKETGIATGRTEIMIHEIIQQNITQITRQSRRSIRVTPDRAKSENANSYNIDICAAQWTYGRDKKKALGSCARTSQ